MQQYEAKVTELVQVVNHNETRVTEFESQHQTLLDMMKKNADDQVQMTQSWAPSNKKRPCATDLLTDAIKLYEDLHDRRVEKFQELWGHIPIVTSPILHHRREFPWWSASQRSASQNFACEPLDTTKDNQTPGARSFGNCRIGKQPGIESDDTQEEDD